MPADASEWDTREGARGKGGERFRKRDTTQGDRERGDREIESEETDDLLRCRHQ